MRATFRSTLRSDRTFGDLFTPRQLVALTTFSDLVQEARERVKRDALAAGLPDDGKTLRDGGTGATAYADAVTVYLGVCGRQGRPTQLVCSGHGPNASRSRNTFGTTGIAYGLGLRRGQSPLGCQRELQGGRSDRCECIGTVAATTAGWCAAQMDAQKQAVSRDKVVSTDPPYYDNIGYADLSDFFYVWLRRSLKPVFPELFATLAVPKAEELVATLLSPRQQGEGGDIFPRRHDAGHAAPG